MSARATLAAFAFAGLAACARPPPARPHVAAAALTSATTRCSGLHLSQGIDVLVLGSGGPRGAGRAGSSVLVAFDGVPRILVDAGPGAFVRLGESGLSTEALDTSLLTHLHIDHAGDLPAIVKSRDVAAGGPLAFRIVGPVGRGAYPNTSEFVARLFGPDGAFAYLPSFANLLQFQTTDVPADTSEGSHVVYEERDVVVSSIGVDHGDAPAVAYRIERAGRSLVVSGDLASRHTRFEELARGADVLLFDAAVLDPPGSPKGLYELHTPPARIGEIAARTDVKLLVLTHVTPPVDEHRNEVLASIQRTFRGEVRFATDCMHLPFGAAQR